MDWADFRFRYTELKVRTMSGKSGINAENRLDICERIAKPATLADMADTDALEELQIQLLEGKGRSRPGQRGQSPATVHGYMQTLLAALNWAAKKRWLPSVPGDRPHRCGGRGRLHEGPAPGGLGV